MSFTPVGYHSIGKKRTRPSTASVQATEDIDKLQDENEQLKKQLAESESVRAEQASEIQQLKDQLKASSRVSKLFKRIKKSTRTTSTGGRSGGCYVYSNDLTALAIQC